MQFTNIVIHANGFDVGNRTITGVTVMDRAARILANRDNFNELYEDLITFLAPLDAAAVVWRPPAPEANTIAALVRHTAGANDMWLRKAAGDTVIRDRDAEFHYEDTPAGLVDLLKRSREATNAALDRLLEVDPAAMRSHTFASSGKTAEITVGWCIEHALVHMAEHWGHIQLTAQLFAAR